MVDYDGLTKSDIIALIIYYETPGRNRDKLPRAILSIVNNILKGD